jgi:quercetin dioxygenase-like cupin family protein
VKIKVAAVVACSAAAVIARSTNAQQVASAHLDVLAKSTSSWNGKPYTAYRKGRPQLIVLKFTIPPNTALPWRFHPIPNAGYVVSGELTIEDKATGKKQTFRAGQAFTESVDDPHRGVSGPEPVVFVVTYADVAGVPTFVQLPGQKPEY